MTRTTATGTHTDPWSRRRHREPLCRETHEVRYLDMSGDGVPDAVEHIDRRSFGDGRRDTVEVTRRLAYGIDINGKPAGVTECTTVFVRDDTGRLRKFTRSDR